MTNATTFVGIRCCKTYALQKTSIRHYRRVFWGIRHRRVALTAQVLWALLTTEDAVYSPEGLASPENRLIRQRGRHKRSHKGISKNPRQTSDERNGV